MADRLVGDSVEPRKYLGLFGTLFDLLPDNHEDFGSGVLGAGTVSSSTAKRQHLSVMRFVEPPKGILGALGFAHHPVRWTKAA